MKTLALLTIVTLAAAAPAAAADMTSAFAAYQSKDFSRAAVELYEVSQKDSSLPNRQQAEFLLGKSLQELGYYIPALAYYRSVIYAGTSHPSHKEAWTQLIDLARLLKDDFIVPIIVNARYDADAATLGSLDADRILAINYMIGALSYRGNKMDTAYDFLGSIKSSNPYFYFRARYMMGVIRARKQDNKGAVALFDEVISSVKEDEEDEDRLAIRNMAILGKARAYYALQQFKESTEAYRSVPRFSNEWFDALLENAWANFQQEDYGRALGEIESVLSPYFNKHFRAEAYVLGATIYYSNCQFDRTRGMLDAFKERYEPELEKVNAYLASDKKDGEIYKDLVNTADAIPTELLRHVRRNGRVLNFHRIVSEINREQGLLGRADNWRSASLRGEIEGILKDQKESFENATGKLVRDKLKLTASALNQFVNNARLIKFETATSEKEVLEAGGEIAGMKRKRLPRPDIPNDQHQHWNFRGEYWVDEVGYYVHSVRKECVEAGVAQQ